jgi:asparagine synthase (glutamine-hydrolysing)
LIARPATNSAIRCLYGRGFLANQRDLARELELPEGVSDLDVAESLCERQGVEGMRRMAGPFSCILWDGAHRRLIAIADRAGAERIYYASWSDGFLIGEVEGILDTVGRSSDVDERAIACHLAGSPIPLDATFYRGVRALRPGHLLLADRGSLEISAYWRLTAGRQLELSDDDEYLEALWTRMQTITAEYLDGDEAGISLSGGLDSPAVACALRSIAGPRRVLALRLVASGLPDSGPSREVAESLGLEDHPIDIGARWPLSAEGGLRARRPSPDVPIFSEVQEALFESIAEAGVKILFTGWGGDELFGGAAYCYTDLLLTGRWDEFSRQLRSHLEAGEDGFLPILTNYLLRPLLGPIYDPVRHLRAPRIPWIRKRYQRIHRSVMGGIDKGPLVLPGRRRRWQYLTHPGGPQTVAPFFDAGRRWGVEIRNPLTDHRLKEFAMSLPTWQTFSGGRRKAILRRVLSRHLPATTVDRLGKRFAGFLADRGLREKEVEQARRLLTGMRSEELGFIYGDRLRQHYEDYVAGKTDDSGFWPALTLEAWLREHFEADGNLNEF